MRFVNDLVGRHAETRDSDREPSPFVDLSLGEVAA
jgi:hypothetical protein